MKDFTDIIIAPVITEKAAIQAEANIYTFKVAKDANKIEIKKYSYVCGGDCIIWYSAVAKRDDRWQIVGMVFDIRRRVFFVV